MWEIEPFKRILESHFPESNSRGKIKLDFHISRGSISYGKLGMCMIDEMRALMEVASFITASPLIPCYPTNPVIATGRPDYRG